MLAGYDNGDVKLFDLRMNQVCTAHSPSGCLRQCGRWAIPAAATPTWEGIAVCNYSTATLPGLVWHMHDLSTAGMLPSLQHAAHGVLTQALSWGEVDILLRAVS